MKIKLGTWRIDSSKFIRVEWHKYFPKIILHEKLEKVTNFLLCILIFIGGQRSVIALPRSGSIWISMGFILIVYLFYRFVFEFSSFEVSKFPYFKVKSSQWVTSDYLSANPKNEMLFKQGGHIHFGPVYKDKDYAIKIFNYIRSWNDNKNIDLENVISVSIIIEGKDTYSTYIYPTIHEKEIDKYFQKCTEKMAIERHGKSQQKMLTHTVFWKTNIKKGEPFEQFINTLTTLDEFYFAPFYLNADRQPILIDDLKIRKNKIKIKSRNELTNNDLEYYFR